MIECMEGLVQQNARAEGTCGDEIGALQADVLQVLVGSDGSHEMPGPHLPKGVVVQHEALHHAVVLQGSAQHHRCRRAHAGPAHVQLLQQHSHPFIHPSFVHHSIRAVIQHSICAVIQQAAHSFICSFIHP